MYGYVPYLYHSFLFIGIVDVIGVYIDGVHIAMGYLDILYISPLVGFRSITITMSSELLQK